MGEARVLVRRALLALAMVAVASLLSAAGANAQAPAVSVLVFHGAPNETINAGVAAIEALGTENDFEVETTQSAGDFTEANLADYRAVIFLGNAGTDQLNAAQEAALQGYINDGGGFVGIGGAAEAESSSTFFGNLIGARPSDESEPGTAEMTVAVGDRINPSTRHLPLEWTRQDVWYEWESRPTGQVHTVARYHAPDDPAGDGTSTGGTDWPISWCRDFQGGRSFYTGMGRTTGSYGEADFRGHLLGAIQWSSGMIRAGCKATISSNYTGERLSDGTSGDLDHTGESHGVAPAPNGWVFSIGRADCRTDAQRGAMIGQGPTPRILDFANRNVGIGCGNVHIWDPEQHNGTVNSGVTLAGILPVYGDRGGGDEINGKIEAGLLGITVSPDFEETGHIYLQYFPTFNPDNPVHPGLADGDQRRITKMSKARVSRFTIDLETKQLVLDSEVVIFEYESQIYSCCHRGGGMGFDSEGNLYVTTGDSNSSQRTNGTSGNYQPARCPRASELNPPQDPNVASNDHCGNNAISFSDARRTAGSTNDYNGKMLRFNPMETIPDGAQPVIGVGTTYSLPDEDSPNGPNLFSGTEGNGNQAKPEIYAMGLRNPSRLFIDPETDIPYSAWVGPDAGGPSATLGPSTYENASQMPEAGNYGWPYCMGNQQAYRDRVADGSLRTTNAPGFVSGGPAGAPTQGWYDCNNLVNDSTNNTGLTVLPHATGTGKDAGRARPLNLWYSRGNPGGNNGCPEYPRPNGAGNAPNYGATDNPATPENEGPRSLCPYLTASGATVFNGPVYRYEDGEDNSDRWPEYWDGRWFLQDFGNVSAKHGLLLDPDTDQDGGQPVYADSLRGVLNWQANYMDSKFGPDGALYVHVYQGFFTTGPQAGMYRFSYTGGADTPNPDPQWTTTGTPRQIQFSLGSSGGVSYEWDFGDDTAVSTEPTPTHTYAQGGTFDVTLTVTYADGEELSETIEINVSDDAAAPTTTVQLDGAAPAPTYPGPVDVTLSATDGTGGSGVEWTEYRIDGGAWTRNDNTGSADPLVTEFTVRGTGDHTVEFRSRDRSGNVEDPPEEVSFAIQPPGGGPTCLPQSDEFGGSALDAKWTVLRPASGGPQVSDGSVRLPILQGDFIANNPLASNAMLQDAPAGEWTVTTRLDTTQIDANGEQAGLVIWKSEQPNTFSKLVAIQANSGNHQFEHIVTQNGGVSPPIPQSITPAPGGQLPDQVLMRARYNGTQVIGEFSADDGATWVRVGQENHAAPLAAPLRVGLVAFRGGNGGGTASFDWFRVHEGSEPGGPIECGATCLTKSDSFDGALNTDRWSFRHPTTPATGERAPRTEGGNLAFTLGQGAIDQAETGQVGFLGQPLPTGDFTVEAKINAPGLDEDDSRTDDPYAQVGLGLYQTDDDWIGVYHTRNGDEGSTNAGTYFEVKHENEGGRTIGNRVGGAPGAENLPTYWLQVKRTGDTVTAAYSLDDPAAGGEWTDLQVTPNAAEIFAPEDGPVYIGPLGMNGAITTTYEYIRFTPDDCPGDCHALSDQFEEDELDPKWEIVNPVTGSEPSVGDGHLTLPVIPGDLFGGNASAQMLLQQAPAESWVATAKIAHANIDTNGEAAGLALINSINPNHFVKTAVQFKNDTDPDTPGDQPGKWAERVVTSDGNAVVIPPATVPWPNSGALDLDGAYVWARFVYDAEAQTVTTWTSTDGTTFNSFGAPISVEQYLNEPGGFRVGLFAKHDGSGDDEVDIDAFNVVASNDPQTPGDDCGSGGDTGDNTPPSTTHALDPAEPDGEEGWYTSPVEVTLTATDNEGGSGVDVTEWRFEGDEEWTAYDGPFTVDDEGRHTIEYHSIDAEGNTESPKSVSIQIDPNAPTTTARLNGEAPVSNYDGPVEVDLDADDGDGSGVRVTEIRVDGGEWQPYAEEEVILNSAADLARWDQAGPGGLNWVTDEGGFARTFGGLGMPWYPVKDYGDFSLKMQWRDSSTGTNGNAGVFVRFPHPEEAVARPPAERFPCQVGSATSQPAWVAIFCGHEIQINDHQGDAQKTGSIYNFSPNNAEQAQIQPRGTWVDYEVRVVGQTYTIVRNGNVIKTFQNSPDQQSTRPGDPPTNARQFVRGYIGLQNHGTPDVVDFRNVRVQSLDEGSVQGPVTVEGDGAHTVEYRSTDVAGNQEETKSVNFTIGEPSDDTTDPVTSHELDPANPGAGGTYDEPVDVTLSATDPDEGGGPEPQTHDVNATGFTWTPDALDIAFGDVVRWNFPSGGFPHDVWVIEPGEAPDSAGVEVTDGAVPAGGPPVSRALEEAGTWTYVCKLHSAVSEGRWQGMVGTADVGEDTGSGEASGVDFTEYRVNTDGATGDWVRSDNSGNVDPFETAFTVSAPGDHVVEYRSTDNAGNQEDIKSVDFAIEEGEAGAPIVRAFADPASGAAPLHVRFSATAIDPDGGDVSYRWSVEGVGNAFGPSFEHTFRTAGEYVATVTATDDEGDTSSDEVTVTVGGTGNAPPTVAASSDVTSGSAPLAVQFEAAGNDPDGSEDDLRYAWDFGDGAASFEQDPRHTYMEPGTYTATVTVEDAGGASSTDTVEITVTDPPGNIAPNVDAAALPETGEAPLDVLLTAQGTDPDGDELTYTWDFGDGGEGEGESVRHTYEEAGTFTATVTADDGNGGTDTAEVEVVVEEAENQPPTVEAVADPASGTAPLEVRFSASARDPDGGGLLYEWAFGDGSGAGGPTATHTYATPGTYTATITVTDEDGATASDTVQVTVTAVQGLGGPPAAGDIGATAAPQPAVWFGLNKPARRTVGQFARRGLKVQVTCTDAMSGSAALKVTRRQARKLGLDGTTLARRSLRCTGPGSEDVTLKPSKRVRQALVRAEGSVRAKLAVRLRAAGAAPRAATQRVMFKRG